MSPFAKGEGVGTGSGKSPTVAVGAAQEEEDAMPSVQKQLCLFCLRHLMGKECWTMGKCPNCTIGGCGKPHHEMLHEVLKAGKPSAPTQAT